MQPHYQSKHLREYQQELIPNMSKLINTPCVGICSSGIGDDVCRGCKRFAHEVIDWNSYSDEQRQLILERLDHLLIQIIKLKLYIYDKHKVIDLLKEDGIAFDKTRDPHCWVYELIRSRQRDYIEPELWGCRLRPLYVGQSIGALQEAIEKEFFELSQAHYERYIAPGIVGWHQPG